MLELRKEITERYIENFDLLIEDLEKEVKAAQSYEKLVVLVEGNDSKNGGFVTPLYLSDFGKQDAANILAYRKANGLRLILKDRYIPRIPYQITIIDEDGENIASLRCTIYGWKILKMHPRHSKIRCLIETLKRINSVSSMLISPITTSAA